MLEAISHRPSGLQYAEPELFFSCALWQINRAIVPVTCHSRQELGLCRASHIDELAAGAANTQSSRSSLPTSFRDGSDNCHEGGPTLVADQACAGYR